MAKKRIIRALSVPKVKFADVHQSENAEAVRCNLSIVDELNHSSRCQTNSNGRGSAMLNKRHSLVTSDMSINDYVTADENLENEIERKTSQTRGDYQYRAIPARDPRLSSSFSDDEELKCDARHRKRIYLKCKPVAPEKPAESAVSAPVPQNSSDVSSFVQKKSLAQGMMDLALISANTNQLRYILEYRDDHPYFLTSMCLVISSLVLQLFVGLSLIWNARFNVGKRTEMREADRVNNLSIVAIFMITLINVFLSTFGGGPQAAAVASVTVKAPIPAIPLTVTAALSLASTATVTTAASTTTVATNNGPVI